MKVVNLMFISCFGTKIKPLKTIYILKQLNFTYKHVVLGYSSKMKNINVNTINYCITLISYLIYKYWLKVLNTNKVKNKRNFYNFLSFELNNRVKILQNTSEHTCTLHCCKTLTLILHELNLCIYI